MPLCGKDGGHIKDEETPTETLKDAYAAHRLAKQDADKLTTTGSMALVLKVCQDYLDFAKTNQKEATFTKRGEFLFDLCFGLPCRFWDYGGKRKPTATPTKADKIHDGYGAMAHPQSVRQERIEEKELVSDAKRARRARAHASPRGRSDRRSVSFRELPALCGTLLLRYHRGYDPRRPTRPAACTSLTRPRGGRPLGRHAGSGTAAANLCVAACISPEVAQRIGRSLFDQMLAAEGDRAAEEATREFPEYLQEVMKRRVPRGEPS